jgi:hypothetical protein
MSNIASPWPYDTVAHNTAGTAEYATAYDLAPQWTGRRAILGIDATSVPANRPPETSGGVSFLGHRDHYHPLPKVI